MAQWAASTRPASAPRSAPCPRAARRGRRPALLGGLRFVHGVLLPGAGCPCRPSPATVAATTSASTPSTSSGLDPVRGEGLDELLAGGVAGRDRLGSRAGVGSRRPHGRSRGRAEGRARTSAPSPAGPRRRRRRCHRRCRATALGQRHRGGAARPGRAPPGRRSPRPGAGGTPGRSRPRGARGPPLVAGGLGPGLPGLGEEGGDPATAPASTNRASLERAADITTDDHGEEGGAGDDDAPGARPARGRRPPSGRGPPRGPRLPACPVGAEPTDADAPSSSCRLAACSRASAPHSSDWSAVASVRTLRIGWLGEVAGGQGVQALLEGASRPAPSSTPGASGAARPAPRPGPTPCAGR